jgi:hypothetical protein
MDSSKVVLETDSRKCAKILAGVNAALQTPTASRQLYVYTLGKSFAVFDSNVVVDSQGGAVVFLTSQYKPIDIVLVGSVY